MKNGLIRLAFAVSTVLFAGGAAAQDTADVEVTATIVAACSVGNGAATIALGNLQMIDTNGGQTTADDVGSTTFPAICTNGTDAPTFSYASANVDGTSFRLIGADSTEYITYTLHQDSTGTLGAVTHATHAAHPDFTADGTSQNLAIAVKLTPAQKAAKTVQSYSDTITVTVSFADPD